MTIVSTMSTPDLLAYYNKHNDKPVKRFADRKSAEARVTKLIEANKVDTKQLTNGNTAPVKKEAPMAAKKKAAVKKSVTKKEKKSGITTRTVKVAGEVYASTVVAFNALKLPLGRLIPFRKKLIAEKSATFEHDEKKFNFVMVGA